MKESYHGGSLFYYLHAFPVAFMLGLLFFMLGVLVGKLLWSRRRALIEERLVAVQQLRVAKLKLEEQLKSEGELGT